MFALRAACTLGLALLTMAPAAHAQQYGRDNDVVCESQDNRTRECRTPFRNPVVAETLSNAACIEGRTWGSRGPGNVWVTDGCRARFVEGRGGYPGGGGGGNQDVVRCESNDGRTQECAVPRGARMVISRQLSETRCVEGRNWGTRQNRIWVTDGCRAEFVAANGWNGGGGHGQGGYGQNRELVCESQDSRDNSCKWNARWGRPVLLEQLSDERCREGYNWGYDGRSTLWVTRGCRGRFGSR